MTIPAEPAPTVDPGPLSEAVDPRRVREHARQLRATRGRTAGDVAVSVVAWLMAGLMVAFFVTAAGRLLEHLTRVPAGIPLAVFVLIAVLAATALIAWRVRRRLRRADEIRYRLQNFAAANGMVYRHRRPDPDHPGMIFTLGASRLSSDVLSTVTDPVVEYGHHQYSVRAGKHSITQHWGYVALGLSTTLPHIVLDSVGNDPRLGSSLPAPVGTHQRLSLEGDFDDHFALYCPTGYERDALYLFSPDIMARFIDHAGQFDVEIIDDTLFLYTRSAVVTVSAARWAELFDTVAALTEKIGQWDRWRDETLPAHPARPIRSRATPTFAPRPGVARPGRRLRPGRRGMWVLVLAVAFSGLAFGLQLL